MSHARRWGSIALLLGALAPPAAAQVPGMPSSKPAAAPQQEQLADPHGRTTPRGTLLAFIRAAERDDFASAARYLQLSHSQRASGEALARDLKGLMDRYFSQSLASISDSPAGVLDDGLPMDRERVGPLAIGERKTDVMLVRVADPQAGLVWLVASETLAQVRALQSSLAESRIERAMPAALLGRELLGLSLAHWTVLAGSLVVPFVLLALLAAFSRVLARRVLSDARELDAWYAGLRWPLVTVLTLAMQFAWIPFFGFPLAFRISYGSVAAVVGVLAFTWLMYRVMTLGFARARAMVWGKDRTSTQSLMVLGERLLKAFVVVIAIFAILSFAGVDTKTALAGLGIGGIALALGAQRTVENLLGGILLLSDRAIAVGDFCRISNRLGVIEDITLRSVRLRTLDGTLVSIPAGVLAQAHVENFATRCKILVKTTLRLRHGTSVLQLRRILEGIRALLDADARIEPGSSRIRLVDIGAEGIELELFAYVLTADFLEFLAVREALLLDTAALVEGAGSGFARPTQFIYMDENPPGADAAVRTPDALDRRTA